MPRPLIVFAAAGDLESVRRSMALPGSLCVLQKALNTAVEYAKISVVTYLLEEAKASVNALDDDGYSALHTALLSEGEEVVRYLVKTAKADIHERTGNGVVPLNLAVCTSNVPVVKYLIESRADLTLRDSEVPWRSAWEWAVGEDKMEVMQYLNEVYQEKLGRLLKATRRDMGRLRMLHPSIAGAVYGRPLALGPLCKKRKRVELGDQPVSSRRVRARVATALVGATAVQLHSILS